MCLQVLDGRIYEQVKDYLVSLCQTELETYQAVHNTFNQLLNSSDGVSLQNQQLNHLHLTSISITQYLCECVRNPDC